ncbi:MAG: hypothetical protein IPK16_15275 [Anaerolineales bacterium]|nr:hypothetical protein [Anaerolineales bacterium]
MIDYSYSVLARLEHEERVRAFELSRSVRRSNGDKGGRFSTLAYRAGDLLERLGGQLKARNGAQPIPQRIQTSQA